MSWQRVEATARAASRVVGDLLKTEIDERQARSIKYQMAVAKMPPAEGLEHFDFDATDIDEALVRGLAAYGFIEQQRNVVLVGGTGAGKTHAAIAIDRACIRRGARGRFFSSAHNCFVGRIDTGSIVSAIQSENFLPHPMPGRAARSDAFQLSRPEGGKCAD
jgi:hypothetical protein